MECHATIVNDGLPLFHIPDADPSTFDSTCTIEFVIFLLCACQRSTRNHTVGQVILKQHCIGSFCAIGTIIVHVAEDILISGNALPIHIELRCKLSYSLVPRIAVDTSIASTLSFKTGAL